MQDSDEAKRFASQFSDKSRKAFRIGNKVAIPHKVKPNGEVVSQETFNAKTDISQLNLNELRFLDVFRDLGWNFDKACEKVGISVDQGKRTYKKCLWFQQEDEIVRAKAKVPSANYILAKDIDNVEKAVVLDDSQHKSLDRMAKITGSFKTTELNITQNVFNLPKLTPEVEAEFKALAEKALEAEIVERSDAA